MDITPFDDYQEVARLVEPKYRLSTEQFSFFWENGYLGPLTCAAPHVRDLPWILHRAGVKSDGNSAPIPDPSTWNVSTEKYINVGDPHRYIPEIKGICEHPSIVSPIAQLLGRPTIATFQSRFRVKFAGKPDPVSWHQDVGERNGGYRTDGTPVPSITVWLSMDGANEESGGVVVLPGTHTKLWGNWRAGFNSKLDDQTDLREVDLARAVPAAVRPGEFYLFHSWTLHLSTTNASTAPRSGLVMRFIAPQDALQPQTEYTMLAVR